MKKDFISYSSGFYDPELTVHFFNVQFKKTSMFYGREYLADYQICMVLNGNVDMMCENKSHSLTNGDIFVLKPYEEFRLKGYPGDSTTNLIFISFHQNLFKTAKGDDKFLRVFDSRNKGEFNIYKNEDFTDFSVYNSIVSSLKIYLERNLGFTYYQSAVSLLITRLNIIFDIKNLTRSSMSSEEYDIKIYDYITSNCFTNITADQVCEKFNISKWYLDKVTNRFYAMPFHKTISSLRMWHAKWLMKYQNITLLEISRICGYMDYSGFYRCYSSFFGVPPKEDYIHFKKHGKFLSDEKNNTVF